MPTVWPTCTVVVSARMVAVVGVALGATAVGALAMGAVAIGALAVGRLAIERDHALGGRNHRKRTVEHVDAIVLAPLDATALTAFSVSVAAVTSAFDPARAVGDFFWVLAVGIVVGLAVGFGAQSLVHDIVSGVFFVTVNLIIAFVLFIALKGINKLKKPPAPAAAPKAQEPKK